MKITSMKAGTGRNRIKVEHTGKYKGTGLHFVDKAISLSLYSKDRAVSISIPIDEMERIVEQYNKFKTEYPEHFAAWLKNK